MTTRQRSMTKVSRLKLCRLTQAYLDALGAVKVGERAGLGSTSYDYLLNTPHGPLDVHIDTAGCYLHCRFHDVERACARFNPQRLYNVGLNPHTGKYNEYALSGTAQDAFDFVFKPHLDRAMENHTPTKAS